MESQEFFDSEVLEQSMVLAEGLDRFHYLLYKNDLEAARKEIYKIAESHQRSFIFRNIYWLEVKAKSVEGQVRAARKLVELAPTDTNKYLLAKSLCDGGAEREALGVYHEIIDDSSEPSSLLFNVYKELGNVYLRMKDYEASEEFFNRAHTINSNDMSLVISYGYLYLQKGELEASKEKFAKAICLEENNMEARMGLALLHVTVGEYELACANLSSILEIERTNKMAVCLYYKWSENIENPRVALDYIDRFLVENPNDDEVTTLKVSWFIRQQNYKQALELIPQMKKNYKGSVRNIAQLETYLREMV